MEKKSNLSRKEKNINKVIDKALYCFVKDGIEGSKISEIAELADLTERSVFRYFETKADLVLETSLLFWKRTMEYVSNKCNEKNFKDLKGIDQIRIVLYTYSEMYFLNKQELIFVHEAESYLNRAGKHLVVMNQYPIPYEISESPLAISIRNGIKDKTVRTDIDISDLYYNTFISLLGFIQKLAVSGRETIESDLVEKKRIELFCDLLVAAYQNK